MNEFMTIDIVMRKLDELETLKKELITRHAKREPVSSEEIEKFLKQCNVMTESLQQLFKAGKLLPEEKESLDQKLNRVKDNNRRFIFMLIHKKGSYNPC